jgi:hypothetical protein
LIYWKSKQRQEAVKISAHSHAKLDKNEVMKPTAKAWASSLVPRSIDACRGCEVDVSYVLKKKIKKKSQSHSVLGLTLTVLYIEGASIDC